MWTYRFMEELLLSEERERNDYLIEMGRQCSGLRPMVENILDESLMEKSEKRQNGGKKRSGR